jgi:hypothetical protein
LVFRLLVVNKMQRIFKLSATKAFFIGVAVLIHFIESSKYSNQENLGELYYQNQIRERDYISSTTFYGNLEANFSSIYGTNPIGSNSSVRKIRRFGKEMQIKSKISRLSTKESPLEFFVSTREFCVSPISILPLSAE